MALETPLEIAFHNLTPSPAVEEEVRARVEKLERLYDRLVGCRVAIEAQHNSQRAGRVFDVHIDMIVPGGELVVSRQPKRAQQKYAHPTIATSIRDAFRAAERQLIDYKRKQKEEVVHAEPPPVLGRVAELDRLAGHGFLVTPDGSRLLFGRGAVAGDGFDRLAPGDPVHYVAALEDSGPVATHLRAIHTSKMGERSAGLGTQDRGSGPVGGTAAPVPDEGA